MHANRNSSVFMKRNVWLAFLCLVIIAGLFLLRPKTPPHTIDLIIPIAFENIPSGLIIRHPLPRGIEIRIQGSRAVIERVSQKQIKYTIDLSEAAPGKKALPIRPADIPLPKNVTVLKRTPATINFILEKEVKKKVPVIVRLSGQPAPNFFVAAATAKPGVVMLHGPEHIIAIVEKIRTKPVDIGGLTDSIKKEISLDLPENIHASQTPGIVLAEITIASKIATRIFERIPVKGENPTHPFSITPPGITIEIKGPVTIIEKLKAEKDIKVYVDLTGLKPGVYVRRSAITLPLETTLVSAKPELFTIKIQK